MHELWEYGELTVAQLTRQLADKTGWGRHTVISFLKRLEAKSAVAFLKKGPARVYFSTIAREDAAVEETRELIDKAFSGSFSLMLSTILKEKALTDEEQKEIQHIIRAIDETTQKSDEDEA